MISTTRISFLRLRVADSVDRTCEAGDIADTDVKAQTPLFLKVVCMDNDQSSRYEYYTLRPPREATKKEAADPVDELNDLGADGWELITTVEYSGGGTKFLVLRRPYTGESSQR